MGVKSEKTFEEIVERLVALFKPQAEDQSAGAIHPYAPVPDNTDQNPPSSISSTPPKDHAD